MVKKSVVKYGLGLLLCAGATFLSSLFFSCKDGKKLSLPVSGTISDFTSLSTPSESKKPLRLKGLSQETTEFIEGKRVVVVLGYGYNDESKVASISKVLDENFGLETEENEGLISLFVYPKDFMVGGKERISSIADRIEDKNVIGMIVLGAPEGFHIAMAKIQDKSENGKIPYPVFTFFSQDDVLGSESTSDFVLDYAHKTNTIEGEVTDFIPDFDAGKILSESVSAIIELREPLKAGPALLPYVQKLLDKNKKVVHYVDGETGLPSINHFVFE
ncbi:MAG: hypothetical protein IJ727_12650 [Treponema sp.]|nr:hypothetical protein [Treponema sp.]